MRHWLIAVSLGIVVLAGTAAAWSWRRSAPSQPSVRAETRAGADTKALERRIAELEARPERVVVVQQPTQPADHAQVQAFEPEAPLDPEEEAELIREKAVLATAGLEARFGRETPDPSYSREAVQVARRTIEIGTGSRVAATDCSTSLCKVVVTHDTLEEQRSIGAKVEKEPFFGEGTYFSYDRDSVPPKTTLFVIRAGHSFQE